MKEASFADIPEELQIDILSRLPPKTRSRCNCVSKHWNTILTIQVFMLRHSRSYDKHSKLAFVAHYSAANGYYESVFSFELSDNTTPNRKTMTVPKTTKTGVIRDNWTMKIDTTDVIEGNHECFSGSFFRNRNKSNICNDLICLFNQYSRRVCLLNLKTWDFIHLPAVTTKSEGCNRFWYALGFDPVSKVYKVLSIYGGSKVCRPKAGIFTLGSNHWKPIDVHKFLDSAVTIIALIGHHWRSNDSFCLDGVIYWVYNDFRGARVVTVVAFDLNREVFRDYKLDTISIKDIDIIKYYLTSLKGNPTLLIWKMHSNEIQQLTLFNHKNPEVTWNRRSFTARNFLKNFPYGGRGNCVAGGSILLRSVKPIKYCLKSEEKNYPLLSRYIGYDLENLAIV